MLDVYAFVGFDTPVCRQALDYLRQERKVVTSLIEPTVTSLADMAVLIESPGEFCGNFLRVLPDDPDARRKEVAKRGFKIPEIVLTAPYVIVLKPPREHKGRTHNGVKRIARFYHAVDFACGHEHRARRSRKEGLKTHQASKHANLREQIDSAVAATT